MLRVFLDPASGFTDRPPANLLLGFIMGWTPDPRLKYVNAAYRTIPEWMEHLLPYGGEQEISESKQEETATHQSSPTQA